MCKRDNSVGLFVAGVGLGQVAIDSACATCRCSLGVQGAETCTSGDDERLTYLPRQVIQVDCADPSQRKKARRENLG